MAEYIDKETAIGICMDSWGATDAAQGIKDEPPADVVEQDKMLDKIKQIRKGIEDLTYIESYYDPYTVIEDVLEVIDKSIEETKPQQESKENDDLTR